MEEKRNYKQEFKDWWSEHKKQIKTGAICLGVGLFCGFVKGVSTMSNVLLIRDELNRPLTDTEGDNSEYTDENVDESVE